MRRLLVLLIVAALWLPALHLVFRPRDLGALADDLARHQRTLALAGDTPERALLRRVNPEWDLMGRTFTVLSFANLALSGCEDAQPRATTSPLALRLRSGLSPCPRPASEQLLVMDTLIASVLRDEQRSSDFFMLPYVHRGRFRDPLARSLFVEGEVALMLAARQLVEPRDDYAPLLRARIDTVVDMLERAPVLAAESYPDEGWTFCNSIALAAIRISDRVDGRDHSALLRRWVASARKHLVEPHTGLLISSFNYDGATRDGPEGSSLWLAAHMLQLVDPAFARDQYQRARRELVGEALGFAWAAEWPRSALNVDDIDSGPTVPLVNANAGSSGLALLGAAAFDDDALLEELVTSLRFAAFPVRDDTGLRFAAGNQLADAVLLYALVEGPLWRRALEAPAMEAHR